MRRWPALVAAVLATACEPVPNPNLPGIVELQIEPLSAEVAQYLYSGIADKRRLYIKDVGTWTALWNEVTVNVSPQPPVPTIDFANEAVIVASMGTRNSGGYSITIDRVAEADGLINVTVREVSPGPTCSTTQALTAPVHAVRAPLRSGQVTFVERAETQNC